uniref:Myb-like domain-containing protein n=1 Tax=Oryza brachyantha TaxID=4533 RepID=J3L8S3_ORYBR
MQSGYGGVSEFQQYMLDPGAFAISAPPQPAQPPAPGGQDLAAPFRRPLDIDYIHGASSSKRAASKDKAATPESPAPPPPANYFKTKGDDNAAAASASAGAKISGETITLPPPAANPVPPVDDMSQDGAGKELVAYDVEAAERGALHLSSSRWPKHEVEALIRVRTGLEDRFQEPGLKGPLWEEVSARMTAAGYRRSSKRCKEKWENINKYFRKAKESGKKRPAHAKTCPYFDELDRLYSRSGGGGGNNAGAGEDAKASSELLDAVVKYPDVRCAPPGFPFDGEQNEACEGGGKEAGKEEEARDDGDGEERAGGRATTDQDEEEEEDDQVEDDR